MTETTTFTRLPHRGLIHVEGPERHEFLQGLITNDIHAIKPGRAIYACLLNAQGKFLHDFFISEGKDCLLLECEGGERAQDLYRRLNIYRLRADVKISLEENVPVYAVLPPASFRRKPESIDDTTNSPWIPDQVRDDGLVIYPDTRSPKMGWRSLTKLHDIEDQPFEIWDQQRLKLTIPDGSRDMIPEKSTLLESLIDKLNGICFNKGCYVGQELTARMHYRGLAKKKLYTITGKKLPGFGEEIRTEDGKLIGEMRSSNGELGLALLKNSMTNLITRAGFEILNASIEDTT